ncbi:hypothetical protein JIN85_13185 [Luteolibacter pohnpeiensis]|uniref:Uncharacterized protein n=1 Tax=Luteolibacter pohnpeiensis TaxID=454153 RepID=A0A934S5B6_9BACT|nr:hypothetical protein [Luteolibacter pohnpeiensis]MBK1883375.1 hypothetical protein [Luteolibacter pohnpeiensis]
MNTDLDRVTQRVERLELQNRRLRYFTFGVWPFVLAIITVLVLLPAKIDFKAMKLLLAWVGAIVGLLVIALTIAIACWFLLRVAVDFKNRNSRFVLNPGSRKLSD